MSTSINVRLSDELEKKLKNTVEQVKIKTPNGAEVNSSTIVRASIEEFIEKNEFCQKGGEVFKVPFWELSEDELKNFLDTSNIIINNTEFDKQNKGAQLLMGILSLINIKAKGIYLKKYIL